MIPHKCHCTEAAFLLITKQISKKEAIKLEERLKPDGDVKLCCGEVWRGKSALNVKNGMLADDSINLHQRHSNFRITCKECIDVFKKAGL